MADGAHAGIWPYLAAWPWRDLSLILLLSLIMPLAILNSRNNTKQKRQRIVRGLEEVFCAAKAEHVSEDGEPIIPSFEFVKYKYYLVTDNGLRPEEDSYTWYSLPLFLFIAVSFLGSWLAFAVIPGIGQPGAVGGGASGLGRNLFILGGLDSGPAGKPAAEYAEQALAVIVFAFAGAYVSSIAALVKGISNFDLSPLSFFRASLRMIAACIVAPVIWRAMPDMSSLFTGGQSSSAIGSVALFFAFCVGLAPDLGLIYMLRNARLKFIKQYNNNAFVQSTIVPIEVVDGIDYESRYRLSEHNIDDVQNLATANPIILFVETPFGIYQTIDWVAQAQLICAVGVESFFKLKGLGIRTIFDLERAAGPNAASPLLVSQVGEILPRAGLTGPADHDAAAKAEMIKTMVAIMVDDVHVKRLRQIVNVISRRLGRNDFLGEPRPPRPASGLAHAA